MNEALKPSGIMAPLHVGDRVSPRRENVVARTADWGLYFVHPGQVFTVLAMDAEHVICEHPELASISLMREAVSLADLLCPDCGTPLSDVGGYWGCLCLWGGKMPNGEQLDSLMK